MNDTTTTCQICARPMALNNGGRITRHGYHKTNGQHRNDYCEGSNYPAFEQHRGLLAHTIENMKNELAKKEETTVGYDRSVYYLKFQIQILQKRFDQK